MDLPVTRALIRAATSGALDATATKPHPIFNLQVPVSCPGVPDEVLDPESTWADKRAYEAKALELARMFRENFRKFEQLVPSEVTRAGPSAT